MMAKTATLVGLHRDLQRPTTVHLLQCLLVLRDGEHIRHLATALREHELIRRREDRTHHALDADLPAVEVLHRPGEAVRLREGPDDLAEQATSRHTHYLLSAYRAGSEGRTWISSWKILYGDQCTRAALSYTP